MRAGSLFIILYCSLSTYQQVAGSRRGSNTNTKYTAVLLITACAAELPCELLRQQTADRVSQSQSESEIARETPAQLLRCGPASCVPAPRWVWGGRQFRAARYGITAIAGGSSSRRRYVE
eukprot:COSAG01_NODE_335_length_18690_cov_7.693185_1_plen_120_part_00